jgi:hypothetical protein
MSYLRSGEDGNPGSKPRFRVKTEIAERQLEALRLVASRYRMDLKTPEDRLKATQKALELDPSLALGEESRIRYKHRLALNQDTSRLRKNTL